MKPPSDSVAEVAVVGGMITWPVVVPEALDALDVSDFDIPRHQRLFLAVSNLYSRGDAIETSGILAELRGMGENDLSFVSSATLGAERNISGAIRIVQEMSLRRRLLAEAVELQAAVTDPTKDPLSSLDTARASLASLQPLSGSVSDDEDFDDFLNRTEGKPSPWVIEGLLREKWRVVLVAHPGEGKTWLLRQLAVCAAYGIRPLRPDLGLVRPVSTFVVDLENTDDHIYAALDMLSRQARRKAGEPAAPKRLWRRPGGIDLRKRGDRAALEKMFTRHRPELLVLGPLYKSYRVTGSDSWDLVAREVQAVLDDWRERFSLSMILEDHAPHGKLLRPYGSSLWERWPELGLGLESQAKGERLLSRWRGDRMPNDWPDAFVRDKPWPWSGKWKDGMPGEESF